MIPFTKGDKACHLLHGWGDVVEVLGEDRVRVKFHDGTRVIFLNNLIPEDPKSPRWSQVLPGDTVQFKVQGDTLNIKAQGEESQPTVLGWKTTELDGVWDLLSIKKRNPPVPVHFGAKVEYRDKQWVLLYASMLPGLQGTKHRMIWVEINNTDFGWVGHRDIDRERFEVIFTGWQNL